VVGFTCTILPFPDAVLARKYKYVPSEKLD
jgi:hypothetical protein